MATITNIRVSKGSDQALVTLENGDRHVFGFDPGHYDEALAELLGDAQNGKLGEYLDFFESDTDDEVGEAIAQANDWVDAYTA